MRESSQLSGTQPFVFSILSMDTLISFSLYARAPESTLRAKAEKAARWFSVVEQVCSRFDEQSEVMQLVYRVGEPIAVSPLLFAILHFALEVARLSKGVFDPTLGHALAKMGFNRQTLTGKIITYHDEIATSNYQDVHLDREQRTVTLHQPLILDLGGIAKGFAIDLAAKELADLPRYTINAGGDLYVKGHNEHEKPWHVGIQHPLKLQEYIRILRVSDMAVCTSGNYLRRSPLQTETHHLLDPRTQYCANDAISTTVIAPNALLADALSTTAHILGPIEGIRFLAMCGVHGLIITPSLKQYATPGLKRYFS